MMVIRHAKYYECKIFIDFVYIQIHGLFLKISIHTKGKQTSSKICLMLKSKRTLILISFQFHSNERHIPSRDRVNEYSVFLQLFYELQHINVTSRVKEFSVFCESYNLSINPINHSWLCVLNIHSLKEPGLFSFLSQIKINLHNHSKELN